MSDQTADTKTVDAVIDLLCEEAMEMPANELLRSENASATVRDLRAAMEKRIASNRRNRLANARERLDRNRVSMRERFLSRPLDELKATVQRLLERRGDLPERLTLAFRSGNELTDHDWETLVEDLWELGFLDEDTNDDPKE